jgi:hypothetical protein
MNTENKPARLFDWTLITRTFFPLLFVGMVFFVRNMSEAEATIRIWKQAPLALFNGVLYIGWCMGREVAWKAADKTKRAFDQESMEKK